MLLLACSARPALAATDATPELTTLEELDGKRIGMGNGAAFDQLMEGNLEGTYEFSYYNSVADAVAALRSGRIDAYVDDDPVIRLAVARNEGIAVMPESFMEDDYGFVFAKGSPLVADVNRVIEQFRADGTLDELKERWMGADEAAKVLPKQDWDTPNGTLTMVVDDTSEPMSYVGDGGQVLGYSCELGMRIAKELGYGLQIKPMAFASVLASVQSGKADFGGGNISITDERKKTLDFSVPDYYGAVSFAVRATADAAPAPELKTVEEVLGGRIGLPTGSAYDLLLTQSYDGVSMDDFSYYNTYAELVGALKSNKIDAFIADLPVANLAVSKNEGIAIMPEPLVEDHYAYVLQKDSPLTPLINERIEAYQADGTIEALYQKWTGSDEAAKTMPSLDGEAPNGTLKVIASGESEPMTYVRGGEVVGFCPELMGMIAQDLGYRLEYRTANISALIAEVESGKADIAMSCFSITEERKKVVDMTEPFYDGGMMAVVRLQGGAGTESQGFLEGLTASFERTFVTEDRWKLVLDGLGVTMLIAVVSGVLGCALGFVLVLLRRDGNRVATALIGGFESLMGGLPIVAVLMVLYYVVFGSLDVSGTLVAILAFTLVFGASAGSIMWNAVQAVDVGQTEAGRALGFSDRSTFFLVVLPQAARRFLPLLRGQFVSLVKDTSVVGYIAVQDLTRASDLIRSRTMEAFFPLVAMALIYFALCQLLSFVLDRLIRRLEPTKGPRTIKGVEL